MLYVCISFHTGGGRVSRLPAEKAQENGFSQAAWAGSGLFRALREAQASIKMNLPPC